MRDKIHITKHHGIARLEKRAKIATYAGLGLVISAVVFFLLSLRFNTFNIYQLVYLILPVAFICCYLIGLLDADFTIYKDSIVKEIRERNGDKS